MRRAAQYAHPPESRSALPVPRSPRITAALLVIRRACGRWKPAAWVFAPCFACALALALLLPNTYQSTLKLPVSNLPAPNPRLDPTAPPAEDTLTPAIDQFLSEDLLRQVALRSHLAQPAASTDLEALQRQELAVRRLQSNLTLTPQADSGLIEIAFRSSSPEETAEVLRNLAAAYAGVYRLLPAGPSASTRLNQLAESNRARLAAAQAELARFTRARRPTPATLEVAGQQLTQAQATARRALLRRVADLQSLDQTLQTQLHQASLAERIDARNLSALGAMEPTQPRLVSAPPRTFIALLGLLAAALLAVATAFTLELLSDRLHTRHSVEQAIGLPVLASIPPNAVAPAFQNAFPALYLAMQRPSTAFEGKLS